MKWWAKEIQVNDLRKIICASEGEEKETEESLLEILKEKKGFVNYVTAGFYNAPEHLQSAIQRIIADYYQVP